MRTSFAQDDAQINCGPEDGPVNLIREIVSVGTSAMECSVLALDDEPIELDEPKLLVLPNNGIC